MKVSVTIEPEILDWVEATSGPGKKFASLSHAIEYSLYRLREQLEED